VGEGRAYGWAVSADACEGPARRLSGFG